MSNPAPTRKDSRDKEWLLNYIIEELISKGIKATTMDSLAASLQMSKRTLYEIFSNKENMVREALLLFNDKLTKRHCEIYEKASNIMEAMVGFLENCRNWMNIANVNFFRDIEEYYCDGKNENCSSPRHEAMVRLLNQGVEEGFFRKDLNVEVSCRLLNIQMESLKRMEELFPPDITLIEAYDSICMGFLRSISTVKGIEYLDRMKNNFNRPEK